MYKIYITDHEHDYSQIEEKILKKQGALVIGAQCRTEQDVVSIAGDADGLLVAYAPITKKVIAALNRCKVIVKYGVGYDNIDVAAATKKGIFVANVPDYCIEEVASHTLALILGCARRIVQYDRLAKTNRWGSMIAGQIERISKQKLGLLGFGRIGCKVAYMAMRLGFKIIVHDPYILAEIMKAFDVRSVDLEKIFSESDYLSIHLPLNSQTRHFVDDKLLGMMKKSAFLINTSRGLVVNQNSLIKALQNRQIAGAALDTFEVEPLDNQSPLIKMENVILSPHAAWYSEEANVELRMKAAEEVVRVLKGGIPENLINTELS